MNKGKFIALALAATIAFATLGVSSYARGGFSGGGGRSFSSSGGGRSFSSSSSSFGRSSYSSSSSSRPSAFGRSSNSSSSSMSRPATIPSRPLSSMSRPVVSERPIASFDSNKGVFRSSASGTPTLSKTDAALFSKAKSNGTVFNNRKQAQSAFESKYKSQYVSRFSKEPSVRPNYIPQRTRYNGGDYTVTYNQQYGGYGYMYLGHWMMYDALQDNAMRNRLMNDNHYYSYASAPVHHRNSNNGNVVMIVLGIVFVVVVLVIIIFAINMRSRF